MLHADGLTSALVRDEATGQEIGIGPETKVFRRQPAVPIPSSDSQRDAAVESFISAQYRVAMNSLFTVDAVWMNSANKDRLLDQNKLFGAKLAREVGFSTIPTVLTDSPQTWRRFVKEWGSRGDLAVKPVGAWAAKLLGGEDDATMALFTTRLARREAEDLAEAVAHAPVLLQPYTEKAYELRVTAVNDQLFACRIDSQNTSRTKTDWRRYDLANTPHAAWGLDESVSRQLQKFMTLAGLRYAAFDFIVTPSGETVFVEVNPAGQFGWIEELSGLPISAAIADWLLSSE
ncbi:hypothetical protein AB0M35_25705 [Micromonospora sp. NPDC051196]|uniref:hypothetical protein n=1 Tax=Micromonospora sp. NPDC051196 TaxID=3155281 RepID=UPI00343A38ED